MNIQEEVKVAHKVFKDAQAAAVIQAKKLDKLLSEEQRALELEILKDLVAEMEAAQEYYSTLYYKAQEAMDQVPAHKRLIATSTEV